MKSVLDAVTFSVLPAKLQVPLTRPLATPEVRVPVNVPVVRPLAWLDTLQLEDTKVHSPIGAIWSDARVPLNDTVQLLP